jgi:HD-GYP domain-containing protein (c-di-GMP phosphodiesterase class II)
MKSFPVEGIPPSSYFSRPVYIDDKFVVASPEMPFTADLAKTLCEWDFTEVLCDGEPTEGSPPGGEADRNNSADNSSDSDDLEKVRQAERFYASFKRYVETLFSRAAIQEELNFLSIAGNVKNACEFVRENQRYLMRVQQNVELTSDKDYLVSHTVRSTVVAIIIGLYLKLPNYRLIELGTAALLHEIGMLKLPPQCYLSSEPLTEEEKKMLYTHPIHGYNMLKKSNFSPVISTAVLEHHERENGSGYPQKLYGDRIGLYAKIIALACSYEAISAKRPHRETKDGYTVMVELLRNEGKQYHDTIIRALVYSLSIYPIGLYVLLSDGKKAQVVDINPANPRFPIVQIPGELLPGGKNKTVQTSQEGIFIVRPLGREETEG